jgi:flagellar protein FlaJ
MAMNIEKYVHILGVNTISQLITYLGIVFVGSFAFITIVEYPLFALGFLGTNELIPILILNTILAALVALAFIMVPAKIKQENIERNFPVFMAYLGAMTTSKSNYEEFFKALAETEEYGEISKEMKRLYHLAKDWKLGYARACKVVSETTPSPIFSRFLARLSQVVEYGEDIETFFRNQYGDIMRDMQTQYQQAAYKINTVAELFSALFVSVAFLLAFAVMLPMFFPISTQMIALGTFVVLLLVDMILVAMARASVPVDDFVPFYTRGCPEHFIAVIATWIGILASAMTFVILFVLQVDPIWQVAISAIPLIVPAYLASHAESVIRQREHSYVPFIRTLGDLVAIREGAITPVLKRLRRHIYAGLNEAMDRLYRRLAITRQIFHAFELFSRELGSSLIAKFNEMFIRALYLGADPKKTGVIIGDQMHAILDSRKLRLQIAGGAKGMLYGTYWGVALGVFIAVMALSQVFSMFANVLSGIQGMAGNYLGGLFNFNVDLAPLVGYMVYMFAMEAAVLAVVIKILDGGLLSGSTKHYIILIIGLVIVYFMTKGVVSMLFPTAENVAAATAPSIGGP